MEKNFEYYWRVYTLCFQLGLKHAMKCEGLRHVVGISAPGCNLSQSPRLWFDDRGQVCEFLEAPPDENSCSTRLHSNIVSNAVDCHGGSLLVCLAACLEPAYSSACDGYKVQQCITALFVFVNTVLQQFLGVGDPGEGGHGVLGEGGCKSLRQGGHQFQRHHPWECVGRCARAPEVPSPSVEPACIPGLPHLL